MEDSIATQLNTLALFGPFWDNCFHYFLRDSCCKKSWLAIYWCHIGGKGHTFRQENPENTRQWVAYKILHVFDAFDQVRHDDIFFNGQDLNTCSNLLFAHMKNIRKQTIQLKIVVKTDLQNANLMQHK
jgi:hypothetical protein